MPQVIGQAGFDDDLGFDAAVMLSVEIAAERPYAGRVALLDERDHRVCDGLNHAIFVRNESSTESRSSSM